MVESFHTDMNGTMQFNGSSSQIFDIRSTVKQSCILGAILFSFLFCWKIASKQQQKGRDHTKGSSTWPALEPRQYMRIRDMLFADDAAVATHAGNSSHWMAGLWWHRVDHQSEEDEHYWTIYRGTASHHHRRILTRCCMPVHTPRLRHGSTVNNNLSLDK